MSWTIEDEKIAKKEYQLMIDTLRNEPEFKNEWKGHWDDKMIETFSGRISRIKGDRIKYMNYFIKNKEIFNLDNLKIENEDL